MKPHKRAMGVALFVLLCAGFVLAYGYGVLTGVAAAVPLDELEDDKPE